MNAHSTKKNQYNYNRKDHAIFTPPPVCEWLAKILEPEIPRGGTILDPACGGGNLLDPFEDTYTTIGCDIEDYGAELDHFVKDDFLTWKAGDYGIDIVVMNPPYNHTKESAKTYGRSTLLPELFADKCFKLFGTKVKMIMFTPMGLRLNIRKQKESQGNRYDKIRDNWGDITSIVSLPMDIFHNVDFDPSKPVQIRNTKKGIMKSNILRKETQQEILFFNMPDLKPHYCLPESVLEKLRETDREMLK